jgi:ATP-dependent helicase/nuclease subunit B
MELWRAEAGSGKTEAVIGLIADTARSQRLARIWVVLPSARQRAYFRERLLERLREDQLPALNVELFNFYSLNRRLLSLMRVPTRSLRGGARQAVLRRVAARAKLDTFGAVANMPGFSRAVGDLIAELKQSRIEPTIFFEAQQGKKDEELARIYDAYQALLRHRGLVDTEGEAWLALESLGENIDFDPKIALLAVDGFDQFTPVQAQMIQALDQRAGRTVVTLTHVPGREDGVGRRFASAQAILGDATLISLARSADPLPCVNHLLQHAFQPSGQSVFMGEDAAQTLTLIEAHSPSAEAAEVMRQIKRRLVLDRIPPDNIMVAVRDWARYQPALSAAAHEYGVPISLQAGIPLTRHPLAALLDALLSLPDSLYAFEAVLDVLRSPYIRLEGLSAEIIAKIEIAARKYNLRAGRETWHLALEAAAKPGRDHRDRETPPVLTPEEFDTASEALARLFDAIPRADEYNLVWNFVQRIEDMIGPDPDHPTDCDAKRAECCMSIAERVRQSETPSDDIAALRGIKDALQELLLTEDLLTALTDSDGRTVAWSDFAADLRAALSAAEVTTAPDRSGRVLITTATDARGSAHGHVFILGLSEGIFPAPLRDDPLYLDSERLKMTLNGTALLRTGSERADDDSLFLELIAQARASLTLSRPSMNSGQAWPPSALWNGVAALIPADSVFSIRRIRIAPGRPPQTAQAASLPELAAAFVHMGDDPRYRTYLDAHDPRRSAHIKHAQAVEHARAKLAADGDTGLADAYTAYLTDDAYHALTASLRSEAYPWSASTLNSLGACAYRVFAEKLLKLEKLEDPTEGADARTEGDLMHLILQETYRHFQSPNRAISPENLEFALAKLEEEAEQAFEIVLRERRLAPSAIWPQQQKVILRHLAELIKLDFSPESPVLQFGHGTRWALVLEGQIGQDRNRPLILSVPLEDRQVQFRFNGTVDRIDCIDDGETLRLVVIDYKRGGSNISSKEILEGRSTQTVLYSSAVSQILTDANAPERRDWFAATRRTAPVAVAGGMFWSIRSGKELHVLAPSKKYSANGEQVSAAEFVRRTMDGIATRIDRLRSGDFRPLPSKMEGGKCSSYCAYSDLCRICELMK